MNQNVEVLNRTLERERAARKQAEQLLEDKARELYVSNRELSSSLDRLKEAQSQLVQSEKMASVGQLAAGVAHEINNPVGFISSNLGTLKEYIQDIVGVLKKQQSFLNSLAKDTTGLAEIEELRETVDLEFILDDIDGLVKESIDGTQRVRKIVSDLSEFSHVNSPDLVEENINALLDKTLNLAWNELKYKAEVNKDYGDIPTVICNGGKFGQVFLNLMINAAHAIEDKGYITLRTKTVDSYVQVEIEDTGKGISEADLAKIFDPFFTTKDIGNGTGLGLHIVQDVINKHGGTIKVSSEVGVGTAFSIRLPCSGPDM